MVKYFYVNTIGCFLFDENFNLVNEELFNLPINDEDKQKIVNQFKNNLNLSDVITVTPGSLDDASHKIISKILDYFRLNISKYKDYFYKANIISTVHALKESVDESNLIIQCISTIEEIDKVVNTLVKRLREWYSYYLPELSENVYDHEKFTAFVLEKSRAEVLNMLNISELESMGRNLNDDDLKPILDLAKQVKALYGLRKSQVDYLDNIMSRFCPNITAITGSMIGAKLIAKSGGLERLSSFPASTIQLLGAEKALFRHMRTGAKTPKHGLIIQHPLLLKAKQKEKGKVARALADKICIAAKVDYFKGEFIGDKLKEQLQTKFGKY